MISRETIDKVNELELFQVISKFVELKKTGANFKAKSPFADENSPSFIVSPAKSIWKCFSSGKGGQTAVSFLMALNPHATYPDIIKELAADFNIEIKYDDSEEAQKYTAAQNIKRELHDINAFALELFEKNSEKVDLKKLRVSETMREKFGIGYATPDFKNLHSTLVAKGVSERQLIEVGLATKSAKGVFDFFNSRTIFPIYNHNNKLTGFGGRLWKDEQPKYINTKETKIFFKSQSLYGIHLARPEIILKKKANLVEGYYDVIALYENGIENTVAPCGTAFTESQAELLKKWCDTIRLMFDGDNAGIKAMEKAIEMLLPLGFKIEVCVLPGYLCDIEKKTTAYHDPDSFVNDKNNTGAIKEQGLDVLLDEMTLDGVEWLINKWQNGAETTIKRAAAQNKAENLLSLIPDPRLRNAYVKSIASKFKVNKTEIEKNVKMVLTQKKDLDDDDFKQKLKLPEGGKEDDFEKYNFVETYKTKSNNIGYWFPKHSLKAITFEKVSNFIIEPIIHIYSKTDNKRLIKIRNKVGDRIIDVPSKGFVGFTQFQEAIIDEGNFFFQGSKLQFQQVMMKILEMFPTCEEIKTLGWQQEGFYCFADGIAETSFKKIDQNGIIEFNGQRYFLPAFSDVYKNVREEDDLYENDRFFTYKASNITFKEWAELFVRVHGDNGKMALAFFISVLFRDYIYNVEKIFPGLFLFGQVSTGKSYCARSINSIFHGAQQGFNLNAGTNVGFFRKIAKFRNTVAWYDEYSNDMELSRFQGAKAFYDGIGHEKGVMSRDNRTESTKVNSVPVYSGQYPPTRDDNSLFTRVMLLTFTRKAAELTAADKRAGSELKRMENEGLSHFIVDVVKYRSFIEEAYEETKYNITESIKKRLNGDDFDGRLLLNTTVILAPIKILFAKLELPFKYDNLEEIATTILKQQSAQISNSDALAEFWKILELLKSTYKIRDRYDYKIEDVSSLVINIDRHTKDKVHFKITKKCLFIRFKIIHSLYLEQHRKLHGENGLDSTSILSYFKTNKTFIGNTPATLFDNGKTSAYVFDYDMLDLELDTIVSPKPAIQNDNKSDDDLPF